MADWDNHDKSSGRTQERGNWLRYTDGKGGSKHICLVQTTKPKLWLFYGIVGRRIFCVRNRRARTLPNLRV